MIDLQPYTTSFSSLSRGQTLRVNHDECPAGQDVRRRLYLTRPAGSPEVVVGYCHNCQDKGVFRNKDTWIPYRDFDTLVDTLLPSGTEFKEPDNLMKDPELWPSAAHTWRIHAGLDKAACQRYNIAYDPSSHRMYLPQFDRVRSGMMSKLEGYQLRRLDRDGPKYLTACRDKERVMHTTMEDTSQRAAKIVGVLVEDYASGIAIVEAMNQQHPIHAIVTVNYGTKVSPEVLYDNRDFDVGIVWLDNDGDHIIDQAHKIQKVWGLLSGKPIKIESRFKDPKQIEACTIRRTLNTWTNEHG